LEAKAKPEYESYNFRVGRFHPDGLILNVDIERPMA